MVFCAACFLTRLRGESRPALWSENFAKIYRESPCQDRSAGQYERERKIGGKEKYGISKRFRTSAHTHARARVLSLQLVELTCYWPVKPISGAQLQKIFIAGNRDRFRQFLVVTCSHVQRRDEIFREIEKIASCILLVNAPRICSSISVNCNWSQLFARTLMKLKNSRLNLS